MKNEYSEKDTLNNFNRSKQKLIEYLNELNYNCKNQAISDKTMTYIFEKLLNNYLKFKGNFFEKSPNKKAGLIKEKLIQLESDIKNDS